MKISLICKKALFVLVVMGIVSVSSVTTVFANEQQARTTVEAYLGGLVTGDIATIKSLVTTTFAERLKHMDTNPEYYSNFLKTRYQGVTMDIVEIVGDAVSYKAKVSVVTPDGEQEFYIFLVEEVDGIWRIAGEE